MESGGAKIEGRKVRGYGIYGTPWRELIYVLLKSQNGKKEGRANDSQNILNEERNGYKN